MNRKPLLALLYLALALCAGTIFAAESTPAAGALAGFAVLAAGGFQLAGGARHCLGIQGISFDVQLTNFAHGIAPDYTSALAELMAPQCVAPAAAGQYVAFDDDEAFRYIDTRRAVGGKGARLSMPTSSPSFSCEPHSLEIAIDAFEAEKVGPAGLPMLREAKTRTLISRNALSREKRVFDAYAAGFSAEAGLGSWTDDDKDPIDEINSIIIDLATATGRQNIVLVVGITALRQINKHPKVLARFPGAAVVNVTASVLEKMLLMPVTVKVAMLPISTQKTGKAATKTIIGGDKIYALLSQPNPSPFDPSAAKTFTTNLGQVKGVGMYEEPPFAEVLFSAWSEDIKITGTACAKRIDVTTGDVVID